MVKIYGRTAADKAREIEESRFGSGFMRRSLHGAGVGIASAAFTQVAVSTAQAIDWLPKSIPFDTIMPHLVNATGAGMTAYAVGMAVLDLDRVRSTRELSPPSRIGAITANSLLLPAGIALGMGANLMDTDKAPGYSQSFESRHERVVTGVAARDARPVVLPEGFRFKPA